MPIEDANSIEIFRRQYFQQLDDLLLPSLPVLKPPDVQAFIYRSMFDAGHNLNLPAQRYQRWALKKLLDGIEKAMEDPEEDEISDDLMECMSALSTGHEISPLEAAQQRSRVVYTVPSTDLFIQADSIVIEESRNLISSAGTTGMRTWDAALHLATYFVSANLISGKRILELGAGTGFLSILCMDVLGAQSVLATDGSLPVVTAIENNIALNDHPRMTQSSRKIEARVLEWGQNSPAEGALKIRSQDTTLDMVIGADVTYSVESINPLVATLKHLFSLFPLIQVLISATVRNKSTFQHFTNACDAEGWDTVDLDFDCPSLHQQTGFFHPVTPPINILQITCPISARQL